MTSSAHLGSPPFLVLLCWAGAGSGTGHAARCWAPTTACVPAVSLQSCTRSGLFLAALLPSPLAMAVFSIAGMEDHFW